MMDREIRDILKSIQTEIEFISHGGRIAFMVEDEGELFYVVKCYCCKDISLISYMNTFDDIQYYKCDKCIAQDIKDEEICGKMHCFKCDNTVISGEEKYWEEECTWYCDECFKSPKVIKIIETDEIAQQERNEKYAKQAKIYS